MTRAHRLPLRGGSHQWSYDARVCWEVRSQAQIRKHTAWEVMGVRIVGRNQVLSLRGWILRGLLEALAIPGVLLAGSASS